MRTLVTTRWAIYWACLVSLLSASCGGCKEGLRVQSNPRRVDFREVPTADRIEIRTTGDKIVRVVTDREQIQHAAEFIQKHSDGWVDVLTGPRAPWLLLNFYQGQRYLGGFGLSTSYLVAGSLSQDVPPEEIVALAKRLEVEWPPQY